MIYKKNIFIVYLYSIIRRITGRCLCSLGFSLCDWSSCSCPSLRAAVEHLNFLAESTFPVPVCTLPSYIDRTIRSNKVDAVRVYASYRLNLLLLKGKRCVLSLLKFLYLTLNTRFWTLYHPSFRLCFAGIFSQSFFTRERSFLNWWQDSVVLQHQKNDIKLWKIEKHFLNNQIFIV